MEGMTVREMSKDGAIRTAGDLLRAMNDGAFKQMQEHAAEDHAARLKALDENPDNGREGWWVVQGLRHSAMARASSAREAVDKAQAAGLVGDWEQADASFRCENLPDVF
jgi:hypothetical protein